MVRSGVLIGWCIVRCSCLRHYLSFAPDLEALLSEWKLAQQGFEAYRNGQYSHANVLSAVSNSRQASARGSFSHSLPTVF